MNVYYVTFRYPCTWCSRVFQSRLFQPCDLVPRFPVLTLPVPRFQSHRLSTPSMIIRIHCTERMCCVWRNKRRSLDAGMLPDILNFYKPTCLKATRFTMCQCRMVIWDNLRLHFRPWVHCCVGSRQNTNGRTLYQLEQYFSCNLERKRLGAWWSVDLSSVKMSRVEGRLLRHFDESLNLTKKAEFAA